MEDRLLTHAVRFGILVVIGVAFCAVTRTKPKLHWLSIAFGMILIHDYFLTNGYGRIPPIVEGLNWNWTGKLMAFGVGLLFVLLLGRKSCGLTLRQNEGTSVAVLVCFLFTGIAIGTAYIWGGGSGGTEAILFRLTMPGLEEEVFYRGALFLALARAFPIKWTTAGIETTPAFLLNSIFFGLVHGFWVSSSGVTLHLGPVIFSFFSGLLFSWLRERTGSLLLPIYMHNAWNTAYAAL